MGKNLAPKFNDFLAANASFIDWNINFKKERDIPTEQFFNECKPGGWVQAAFVWSITPQGDKFWGKLNDKWQEELKTWIK